MYLTGLGAMLHYCYPGWDFAAALIGMYFVGGLVSLIHTHLQQRKMIATLSIRGALQISQ